MATQFIIEGARQDTGADTKIVVEADNAGQAEQIAYVRGLCVSSVRPVSALGVAKHAIVVAVILVLVGIGAGSAVWYVSSRPAAPQPQARVQVPALHPVASVVSGRVCIMGKNGTTEPLDGLEVFLLDDVPVDGKVIRQEYARHVLYLRREASRQTRGLYDPGLVTPEVIHTNLARIGAQIGDLESRSVSVKPRESLRSAFDHFTYINAANSSTGFLQYVANGIIREKTVTRPDGTFALPGVAAGRYCLYAEHRSSTGKGNKPRHAEWFVPLDVRTDVSLDMNTEAATNYRS